jgi:hypothetical protein
MSLRIVTEGVAELVSRLRPWPTSLLSCDEALPIVAGVMTPIPESSMRPFFLDGVWSSLVVLEGDAKACPADGRCCSSEACDDNVPPLLSNSVALFILFNLRPFGVIPCPAKEEAATVSRCEDSWSSLVGLKNAIQCLDERTAEIHDKEDR